MPALSTNARLTGFPGLLHILTASKICLRCQLSYLAVKRPAISRQRVSLEIKNIRGESRKGVSTSPESQDGTSDHKGSPQVQYSIVSDSKGKIIRSANSKDAYHASSLRKIDRRLNVPKLLSQFFDRLIVRATMAGHRINILTGTDYSSIEVLRKEIKEQELFVTSQNAAVYEAREAVDVAHTKQAASQKEVVGLLERKSSWSATDLERYMALIRSEHSNELAVQAAKESLKEAERALEEARSKLEKRERAQYHEEQIWSDTIRRNSTWVTIGLMGVNILILLSSVVIIEPWRRKSMVKEMRTVLDQHVTLQRLELSGTGASADNLNIMSASKTENEGAASNLRTEEMAMSMITDSAAGEPVDSAESFPTPKVLSNESESRIKQSYSLLKHSLGANSSIWRAVNNCDSFLREAFSTQYITIRQNEVTRAILQGASVGAALVVVLFRVFRSG